MEHFEGNVAVVTGAGSGIGRALAARFASLGMRVALGDVDEAGMVATTDEITAVNPTAETLSCAG